MRRLDTASADFDRSLAQLTTWEAGIDAAVSNTVAAIIADIGARGDEALLEYTARFDRLEAGSVAQLEVSRERQLAALNRIDPVQREALEYAAQRVRSFHQHQLQQSWQYHDDAGNLLGQRVTAVGTGGRICSRWQGQLSLFRFDEHPARQSGWCGGSHYGGAGSGRRNQ